MIRAVVLDVDDTLCLTEAACFDLENDVLARLGREPMSRAAHVATWGLPLLQAMPRRSPGLDLDAFAAAGTLRSRPAWPNTRSWPGPSSTPSRFRCWSA
ncbi:hypothetical protein AB0J43_58495, partial [Nonomuraea fuscirosea]